MGREEIVSTGLRHPGPRPPAPGSRSLFLKLLVGLLMLVAIGTDRAEAQPLLLQDILFDPARGSVLLKVAGPLNPSVKYFDRPDRIVMDLPDTLLQGPQQRTIPVGRDGIAQIRVAQFQKEPAVVRVVFDVTPGTRIPSLFQAGDTVPLRMTVPAPDHHLIALGELPLQRSPLLPPVVPPPVSSLPGVPSQLSSLEFRSGEVIVVATQPLAPPTVKRSADGRTVTATFSGLVAPQGLTELPVHSSVVKTVRVIALPAATQLVLELTTSTDYTFRQEAGGRNVFLMPATRPAQPALHLPSSLPPDLAQVQQLVVRDQNDRTDVVIRTDRPMQYRISRVGLPERVVVDLPQSTLARGIQPVITNRDLLTQVIMSQATPDTVRVVLDLTTSAQFESSLSSDGKELRIGLLNLAHALPRGAHLITLDPGHGGNDPGAIGTRSSTEAQVTLAVVQELKRVLGELGHTVLLTRSTDVEVLLQPRVDVANQNRADILVSVHCNASENPQVYGIETYYKWPHSLPLAQDIHQRLVQQLGSPDRGVRRANFFMVNHTTMPAVLVEIGYLSNSAEEAKLTDPAYQRMIARAIADGIKDFFSRQSAVGGWQ